MELGCIALLLMATVAQAVASGSAEFVDGTALVQLSGVANSQPWLGPTIDAGSNGSTSSSENSSWIPIPVPMPIGIFPLKLVVPGKPASPPRHYRWHIDPSRFWSPKDDPAWQPSGGAPGARPAARAVYRCEDIRVDAECSTAMSLYGYECGAWGGGHCLPKRGAKCSDIAQQRICTGRNTGLSCVWNSKGCSPS